MKLSQIQNLYNNFGLDITLPAVCASSFKAASKWKHSRIIHYLKSKYTDVISSYQSQQNQSAKTHECNNIWSLWWQGGSQDSWPEVVKLCFSSINNNRGSHPLIIITKDNYREYIDLPEHVTRNFEAGNITITHLSDFIRLYLLSRYGGLWLDAAIFVTDKLPDEIFALKYYTIKRKTNLRSRNISQERWTGFVQGAEKDSLICSFMYDFLCEYWRNEKTLIDYFLIDYALETALEEIQECREIFDSVPLNNPNVHGLHELLISAWDDKIYNKLKQDTYLFKLAWRTHYRNIDKITRPL